MLPINTFINTLLHANTLLSTVLSYQGWLLPTDVQLKSFLRDGSKILHPGIQYLFLFLGVGVLTGAFLFLYPRNLTPVVEWAYYSLATGL